MQLVRIIIRLNAAIIAVIPLRVVLITDINGGYQTGERICPAIIRVLYLSTELLIMSRLCSKLCFSEGSSASFISNIKANLIFWGWSKTWLRTASLEISWVSTIRWCMRHCGPTLNCHTPVPHTQTKTSQLFRQELNYTPVPIISDLIPYCETEIWRNGNYYLNFLCLCPRDFMQK